MPHIGVLADRNGELSRYPVGSGFPHLGAFAAERDFKKYCKKDFRKYDTRKGVQSVGKALGMEARDWIRYRTQKVRTASGSKATILFWSRVPHPLGDWGMGGSTEGSGWGKWG